MDVYVTPEESVVGPGDRLSLTLFLAVMVHAVVILGVGFTAQESRRERSNTLDIVMVQHRAEKPAEDARLLAQANQAGGGESQLADRPTVPVPAPMISADAVIAASSPRMPVFRKLEKPTRTLAMTTPAASFAIKPQALLTARHSEFKRKVYKKPRKRPKTKAAPKPVAVADTQSAPAPSLNAATLMTRSLAMASLTAELDENLRAFADRPRRKWITSKTREYKYAAYMDAWRAKVERIGNLNYPDEARRRRISGSLLLEVSLKADGSIHEVALRRSSGQKTLDDAAIRIVKLAAPFAPLPKNIRKETDILHIQRTWQFLASARLASR